MPPRDSARGLQYSHEQGDMTDAEIRDIVLVHVLAKKLTFQDLVALPEDTLVDTLLDGTALQCCLLVGTFYQHIVLSVLPCTPVPHRYCVLYAVFT